MRIITAVFLLLCSVYLQAAEVEKVRLWRDTDHTRVVFDLSEPITHKLFTLENPARLVIDMQDTTLDTALKELNLTDTPIKYLRSGVHDKKNLRIVFDLNRKIKPRSFALKADGDAGDRLVVDLYNEASDVASKPAKTVDDNKGLREVLIAIDAGHGGIDPGASGPGKLREKHVVLKIAKQLQALFEKEPGFAAKLIRSGDYTVKLRARPARARSMKADIFISIHADAFHNKQAHGASVFVLSLRGASSTTASFLAKRENAADLVGGVSLGDKEDVLAGVLTDLSMTSTLDSSLSLGADVLEQMGKIARLHKKQVEQAGFMVLKSPDIPSILVETGFISNPAEARKLNTASYQKKMANAIFTGVRNWVSKRPPEGTLLAAQKHGKGHSYTVMRGDTLSKIASRYNVSVAQLKRHNAMSDANIRVGQKLSIPRT